MEQLNLPRVPMQRNLQVIQKQDLRPDGFLLVHSIFRTIQGEGPFAGHPAIFVRLSGCNLQCPACDTDYTGGSLYSVMELVDKVRDQAKLMKQPLVVITGGEPFRQRIGPLCDELLDRHPLFAGVQIETSGTLYTDGPWSDPNCTIVCSPKTPKINDQLRGLIGAYKFVLDAENIDPSDGLPIRTLLNEHGGRVARSYYNSDIYVQPLDEKDAAKNMRNLTAAIESAMKFGYTLCIQVHKIIGME